MATPPDFTTGQVLTAAQMNRVGLWKVIPTSAVNGVVTSDGDVTVNSAVSSVTVNGAFSADYDQYLVTYTGGDMSAETGIKLQLGSTTTGYYGVYFYGQTTGGLVNASDNNGASFSYVGGGGGFYDGASASITIANPYLARQTYVFAGPVSWSTNMGSYTGRLLDTTSYTAFTLTPISGTFTGGNIRVYGYRN